MKQLVHPEAVLDAIEEAKVEVQARAGTSAALREMTGSISR